MAVFINSDSQKTNLTIVRQFVMFIIQKIEEKCVNSREENKIDASLDYLVGLLKIWDTIEEQYETQLSSKTRLLCEGYAKGINYYIENNPNIEQHIYPVNPEDVIAGFMYKTPFFFDLPIFLSALYTRKPDEIPRTLDCERIRLHPLIDVPCIKLSKVGVNESSKSVI